MVWQLELKFSLLIRKPWNITSLISVSAMMKSIILEQQKKIPLLHGHIQFNEKILF